MHNEKRLKMIMQDFISSYFLILVDYSPYNAFYRHLMSQFLQSVFPVNLS